MKQFIQKGTERSQNRNLILPKLGFTGDSVVTILMVAITVLFFGFLSSTSFASPGSKQPPETVTTITVKMGDIYDRIEGLGTTKALDSIILTPNTTEKVTKIAFEDGRPVKKGDVLVELSQAEEQAQLRSADAALNEAKDTFERAVDLRKTNDISEATLKERRTDYLEAEARVIELQARVRDLQIIAPFDGVVGLSDISLGALVSPGDEIATLDAIETLKVDFDISAINANDIKIGQAVLGTVDAFPTEIFRGNIVNIDTRVNPNTRTFTVRSLVSNGSLRLKPGMLMNVYVKTNVSKGLVIPLKTVIPVGEKSFVFGVDPETNTVHRTEIEVGKRLANHLEVKSGLKEGDIIVSEGQVKISDKAHVNPVPEAEHKLTSAQNTDAQTPVSQQPEKQNSENPKENDLNEAHKSEEKALETSQNEVLISPDKQVNNSASTNVKEVES